MSGWDADARRRRGRRRAARAPARPSRAPGPPRAAIDSRAIAPGELFVGLRGEREDGGALAGEALAAGAWGVLVAPRHAGRGGRGAASRRARCWRTRPAGRPAARSRARGARELGGARRAASSRSPARPARPRPRTSSRRCSRHAMPTAASPQNLNTEIGLPLAMLAAPGDTQALVLEMAMRGAGQIAELTAIARARRRRDRQRRPGAPGAARLARGDRRGQGRADRRAARRGDGGGARRRAAARAAPARGRAHDHLRRGRAGACCSGATPTAS